MTGHAVPLADVNSRTLLHSSHRAPLCCEPLRLALAHLTLLHHRRFVHMCTLAGFHNGETASCLLDANEVSTLRSVPTWNVALNKQIMKKKKSVQSNQSIQSIHQKPRAHTCDQGLLYHAAVGTHGPPLQAFISAGLSATQSPPPPPPSLTPPRARHTTSLFCTPGPHCAEH